MMLFFNALFDVHFVDMICALCSYLTFRASLVCMCMHARNGDI